MSIRNKHKEDLGLDVPMGYFSKSKQEILEATVQAEQRVFSINRGFYYWSAAAVIALVFIISVGNPFKKETIKNNVYNDVLIATLAVSDSELDGVVDDFIEDNLLTENIFSE